MLCFTLQKIHCTYGPDLSNRAVGLFSTTVTVQSFAEVYSILSRIVPFLCIIQTSIHNCLAWFSRTKNRCMS